MNKCSPACDKIHIFNKKVLCIPFRKSFWVKLTTCSSILKGCLSASESFSIEFQQIVGVGSTLWGNFKLFCQISMSKVEKTLKMQLTTSLGLQKALPSKRKKILHKFFFPSVL